MPNQLFEREFELAVEERHLVELQRGIMRFTSRLFHYEENTMTWLDICSTAAMNPGFTSLIAVQTGVLRSLLGRIILDGLCSPA